MFLTYPVATLSDIVGRVVLAFDQLGCELIQRLDLLFLGVKRLLEIFVLLDQRFDAVQTVSKIL